MTGQSLNVETAICKVCLKPFPRKKKKTKKHKTRNNVRRFGARSCGHKCARLLPYLKRPEGRKK